MWRRAVFAAGWTLCGLVLPAPIARAQTDRFWEYDGLVERYRQGHHGEAVTALAGWDDGDVKAVVFQAVRRDWRKLEAAMLLHTDVALQNANAGSRLYGLHVSAALTLARALPRTSQGMRFGGRWFLATGLLHAEVGGAQSWLARGLKAYPEDPHLLLALGSFEESFFALGGALPRSQMRSRAEGHFRHALKLDDGLHEARVRLAHLLMGRGDHDAASTELDLVLARAQEPDLLYLARLFRGRLRERVGRLQDAAQDYAAAVALDERCQTARLALSQVRWRLADTSGAAAALAPVMTRQEPSGYMDPWWLYPWAQRWRADALFESLRQEIAA